jgi:hypothetical protein
MVEWLHLGLRVKEKFPELIIYAELSRQPEAGF